MSRIAALTLLSLVGTAACSDKGAEMEENRLRVAVGSQRDATAAVRIEPIGIALSPPREGWKLMGVEGAQALADGAIIGAIGPRMVAAAIIVRPVAGRDIDAYTKRRLTHLLGEPPALEPVDVHETSGLRYAVTQGSLRRAGAIWIKGGMAHELRVWGVGSVVDEAVGDLLGALSFFDRKGRVEDVPTRDQHAADWRVRAGIYENAASGLRVDVTPGLRLVVGAALKQRNPQADVIIEGTSKPISVTIASEPRTSASARSARATAVLAKLGGDKASALSVDVLGAKVRLAQVKRGSELLAFGEVCVDGACHSLMVRYAADAEATVVAALASLTKLSADRRTALLKEMTETPSFTCSVSDGYALRGSTYRSFEHELTFTAPGTEWALSAGAEAKRRAGSASLFVEARRWGLEAALVVDEAAGDEPDVYHAAVVAALTERGGFRPQGGAKNVKGTDVSRGSGRAGLSFVVATQIVGTRGAQLILWGATESVAKHDKEILSLIGGLSSGVEKAVEEPPGGYLDRRIGVSAAMPVGWRMQVETPPELVESGTFVTWELDGRFVALMAMCLPPAAPPEWSARYLEQRLRERIGPFARGAATTRELPAAGREANATSWHATLEHVDTVVMRRGNSVYAIAAVDHKSEALDKVVESLSLLD